MQVKHGIERQAVRLPDGRVLSLSDLPPPNTTRWVASRKARIVQAVRFGLLTVESACRRYDLSEEELDLWVEGFAQHGHDGLKTTAIQAVRTRNTSN